MNERKSEKITSLCLAVLSRSGYRKLLRIADLKDGVLWPFTPDPFTAPREGTNVSMLFWPDSAGPLGLGTVGMFECEYYFDEGEDKWKQDPQPCPYLSWTEIVVAKHQAADEVVAELRTGVDYLDATHDILLIFSSSPYNLSAIHVLKKDLKMQGSKCLLSDNCKKLDSYLVPSSIVAEFRDSHDPSVATFVMRKYCCDMAALEHLSQFSTRSKGEVLYEIMQDCGPDMDIPSKTRSKIKSIFAHIEEGGIEDRFMVETGCTQSEAQEFFAQAAQRGLQIADVNSGNERLLQMLIENNSELSQKFMAQVEAQWTVEHKDLRAEFAEEEKAHKLAVQELSEKEKGCNTTISNQDKLIRRKQKQVDEYSKLETGLQEKIKAHLRARQADMAGLLTDLSIFAPLMGTVPTAAPVVPHLLHVDSRSDKITAQMANAEEVLDELTFNLGEAGVEDPELAKQLAGYLLSAYSAKSNLLLVGFGNIAIADALCATLFAKNAAVLSLSGNTKLEEIRLELSATEETVILVQGAFSGAVLDGFLALLQSFRGKCFLLTVSLMDELAIEPHDLYLYALPLCCDFFCTSASDCQYEYGDGVTLLDSKEITTGPLHRATRLLDAYEAIFPLVPQQRSRIAKTLGSFCCQVEHDATAIMIEQVLICECLIPLALCQGKYNACRQLLSQCEVLTPTQVSQINDYLKGVLQDDG